ncbi:hypothetical protein [Lysobacter gummosus]|uniref:hypothetical protein n=1 Tax=Lysobacter gummosus TaxID=262324 RepID=UPI0036416AF0
MSPDRRICPRSSICLNVASRSAASVGSNSCAVPSTHSTWPFVSFPWSRSHVWLITK